MFRLARNFLCCLVGSYLVFLACLLENLIIRDDVRLLNCAPSSVVFACLLSVIVLFVCFYSLGFFGKEEFINLWTDVNNCFMPDDRANNKGFFMNTRNGMSECLTAYFVDGKFVLDKKSGKTIFDLLKEKAECFRDDNIVPDEALFGQVKDFLELVKSMRKLVGKFARSGKLKYQQKWSRKRKRVKAALNKLGGNSTEHLFAFYSYALKNGKTHENAVTYAAKEMRNFIWDGDLADQWEDAYRKEVAKHSIAKEEAEALALFGVLTETIDRCHGITMEKSDVHHVSPVCVKFILAFKQLLRLSCKHNIKWQTLLQSNAHDLQSLNVLYLVATGKLNDFVGESSDFYNPNPEPDSDIIVGKIDPSLIEGGSRLNINDIRYRLDGAYRIKAGRFQEAYIAYMECLKSKKPGEHVWPSDYCQGQDFAVPYEELSGSPMTRADFTTALQKLEGFSFPSADYQFWMGKGKWKDGHGQIKHCGKLTPLGPFSWFFDDNKLFCTPDGSRSSDPLPHNWGRDGPNPFLDFINHCGFVLRCKSILNIFC